MLLCRGGAVRRKPSTPTSGRLRFSEGCLEILFLSAVVKLIPFSRPVKQFRDLLVSAHTTEVFY